jgi:hypothetical protein
MGELDTKVKQANLVKSVANFYEENRLATQSTPLTRVERREARVTSWGVQGIFRGAYSTDSITVAGE